jgi:hypothetical protein
MAQDETDLLLFPPLRSCWSPVGQAKEVALSGRNARRVVFGAISLRTGSRFFMARERQRAVEFQEFLVALRDRWRGWYVALLLDEDPSHTAKGSVRLAGRLGVELLWLPKRAPQLNPMDTLWGQAKDVVSADHQYPSLDEQAEHFIRHLQSLSPLDALHTAGVLSDDFWLRDVL